MVKSAPEPKDSKIVISWKKSLSKYNLFKLTSPRDSLTHLTLTGKVAGCKYDGFDAENTWIEFHSFY